MNVLTIRQQQAPDHPAIPAKPLGFGAIGRAHAGTDVHDLPFSYRHLMPLHFDPDGRVKDGMFRLRAEQSISVASRFERVSSFFALITQ